LSIWAHDRPDLLGELAVLSGQKRRVELRTTLAECPMALEGLPEVCLLDLSRTAAQIERLDLLRRGAACTLDPVPPCSPALHHAWGSRPVPLKLPAVTWYFTTPQLLAVLRLTCSIRPGPARGLQQDAEKLVILSIATSDFRVYCA
jgi:hypothetical protein